MLLGIGGNGPGDGGRFAFTGVRKGFRVPLSLGAAAVRLRLTGENGFCVVVSTADTTGIDF